MIVLKYPGFCPMKQHHEENLVTAQIDQKDLDHRI